MAVTWHTSAGNLGIITERVVQNIQLSASSPAGAISYSLLAGTLPRGLRLTANGFIKGSPVEVKVFTESKFVIRANDGIDLEDRTFTLSVDGADIPRWLTKEGFLNVGQGESFFVLDNAKVDFQLEATDTDISIGESLEFFIAPNAGELPPGLTLSKDGVISGFTDPVFALEYTGDVSGGYDTNPFDYVPLDPVTGTSTGFDDYQYDNQTYDYSEQSIVPRRLSRAYSFVVSVSDGQTIVNRLFKIYVVTEEFLKSDNTIVEVDTNLFTADNTANRVPIWITESNLGRFRANNYVTIFLDVYDPPTLSGAISYLLLPNNPDQSVSELPPGLVLDQLTGEVAGKVPYQSRISKTYTFTMAAVNFPALLGSLRYDLKGDWQASANYFPNEAVRYLGVIYVCLVANRATIPSVSPEFWYTGISSANKTFTVELIGEIESGVSWITPADRGIIKPNQPSDLFVKAESRLYGGRVSYELISGALPIGLTLLSSGDIQGKVKQFSDSQGPALTRFYDNSTGTRDYSITWNNSTTFNRKFSFTIKARDGINFAENIRTFFITVNTDDERTFANLWVRAFQKKEKRLQWYNFITDAEIFVPELLYRYGDVNFGIQPDLKMMIFAGIESVEAVKYVQSMSQNHYNKRMLFGDVKSAVAKNQETQEIVYEVVYIELIDDQEKNGKSVKQVIELSDSINSKVLTSYDQIKVDSSIPLVSDSDHQRIFPNSIKNMRKRIAGTGIRDREFLPLWMRSIQDQGQYETGFVKALVLCYAKPGESERIKAKIKAEAFDFKQLDFTIDRYIIDIIDNNIQDKYLAFPQRGEKLP